MFEFKVGSKIVAARVGCTAQRALEPSRKVDVVVVPDVGHDLAAQLAPV